ncbi:DUF5908 family protein [Methylobacter luteus]|uniref:DUF5908 family protein n=1 Tax=Methylobacter luteus TaxID=415 RepID=UPI0003FAFD55|nr:DUF5908 family protein [Methylobacter luteus]
MPIEIKELHIHVVVDASPGQTPIAKQGGGKNAHDGDRDDDKEAIIAECVEQVLQILQNKQER